MRILYVTSLSGRRINSFMRSAIIAARQLGYEFTIACNMDGADKVLYAEDCETYGIRAVHVDFVRNPLSGRNAKAIRQLSALMKSEHFDVIHCNTPVGGLVGRICAHCVRGVRVIYQAHGFHFWKGAPLINWLVYYPVEWILSYWTDILITINCGDYALARSKFRKPKLQYVHGVGVDLSRFKARSEESSSWEGIRDAIGITADKILLISVGELNENKNHEVVIRALAKCSQSNVHYAIAGAGELKEHLEKLADDLGISQRVHFLGFRSDMPDVYRAADVFVFPSKREGLPSVVMEAMASSLPCIVSRIRGNVDLIAENEGGYLFNADNSEELASCIDKAIAEQEWWPSMAAINRKNVLAFDLDVAVSELKAIYAECNE